MTHFPPTKWDSLWKSPKTQVWVVAQSHGNVCGHQEEDPSTAVTSFLKPIKKVHDQSKGFHYHSEVLWGQARIRVPH